MAIRLQFSIRSLLIATAVCVVVVVYIVLPLVDPRPGPVRAFQRHRATIKQYVRSIEAGKVRTRNDSRGGYFLLKEMYYQGVTIIRREEDGCIYFVFESMPTDATESIIYCPEENIDASRLSLIGGTKIIKFQQLEPHWFYCVADF